MEEEIFIDAGFWIAVIYENDQHGEEAERLWQIVTENDWRLLTTNWTFYEALTFLNGRVGRHDLALELMSMAEDSNAVIADASDYEDEALAIFRTHSDKLWSVVDCANFVCISKRHSRFALSFDSDFRQAQVEFGFTVLDARV